MNFASAISPRRVAELALAEGSTFPVTSTVAHAGIVRCAGSLLISRKPVQQKAAQKAALQFKPDDLGSSGH